MHLKNGSKTGKFAVFSQFSGNQRLPNAPKRLFLPIFKVSIGLQTNKVPREQLRKS
jgi:hypothetical protein